jgi:iron complex transport system substrate-binding protein
VQLRRGPATVTGSTTPRSRRHWETGKASEGPKPGDLSARATSSTLGGGNGGDSGPCISARVRPSSVPRGWADALTARLRLAALVAAGLVACHPARERPGRAIIVDDAGDTLHVARPPRRIVSLNPTTTELLFALGAGDRLVGRTDACDYPAAAARVASVGGWLPPNVEAVAARAPDLVVLYGGPTNAAAAARLQSLGIPVLVLRIDHMADVPRAARLLGRVVEAVPAADSLAQSFEAGLAQLRRSADPPRAPGVVLLAWDQPLIVLGAGSFVSELVELAGARNVFDDLPVASAPVALESVVMRRPLAIVTLGAVPAGFALRPEWQAVSAVQRHRLLTLTESAFNRPGPRALAAVADLRRRLGPVLQ